MEDSDKVIVHSWFRDLLRGLYYMGRDAERMKQAWTVLSTYDFAKTYRRQVISMTGDMGGEVSQELWDFFEKWAKGALKNLNMEVEE